MEANSGPMNKDFVLLNGEVLPAAEARISPRDRGFLYGDGFFETMRVMSGEPFLLDRHLRRLNDSCQSCGWGGDLDRAKLRSGIAELIDRSGVRTGYLRVTVSRGLHAGGLTRLRADAPTIFADLKTMDLPPLDDPPAVTLKKSGYTKSSNSPVVRHKSISYQYNVLALAEARELGADEVFFLNEHGHLTEGAISNVFFVRDGTVYTPAISCGLLPGITREVVCELCQDAGLSIHEGEYPEGELCNADEVMCTNSLKGIMAVREILDCPDAKLFRGPITAELQKLYAETVREECGPPRGP